MPVDRNLVRPGTATGEIAVWDHDQHRWEPGDWTAVGGPGDPTDRYRMRLGDTGPTWDRGDMVNIRDCGTVSADGVGDDSAATAEAWRRSDTYGVPVFIPPGTYLTDPIDFKMQSMIGTNAEKCLLRSKPGKDILHVNSTIGQFYRTGGLMSNLTFIVDDSVNAVADYPNRGGVGNAGLASDYPDRNGAAPPTAIDWHFDHLQWLSLSRTVGGKNSSAGIYTQNNFFSQFYADTFMIGYLKYGWKEHYPVFNFDPVVGTNFSRDHPHVSFLHFIRNGYQFTPYNWGIGDIDGMIFHGGPSIVDLDCRWNYMTITAVEMVGNAPGQNLFTDSHSYKNEYRGCSISTNNPAGVIWNENDTIYSGNINAPSAALPWLTINGNENRFYLANVDTAKTNYGYAFVKDLGLGNQVESGQIGTSNTHRRFNLTRDGRLGRKRDSHSALLGIVDPPFISADDLFINPRNLRLNSGGPPAPTSYDYIPDPTGDFDVFFRRVGTNVQITFDNNNLNDIDGFHIGQFLPAGKVRVYVKHKMAVAGTLSWGLSAPIGTSKGGSGNVATGTNWSVASFDADLTGVLATDTLRLQSSAPGGGGSGPIDLAWIMFRPWAVDWMVTGPVIAGAVVNKTGAYTVTGNDDLITVDATAGAVTISLMTGLLTPKGQVFTIKKIDASANAVTIARVTNGTIDGVNSILLRDQWDSVTLRADGTNFSIVSRVGAEIRATATLDFPSIAVNACAELTINCIGAATGDVVWLAPPAAFEAGLLVTGFISATNTVRVRVCNQTAAPIDPASATWSAMVLKLAVA